MISVHFQGKPFYFTVIPVYALTNNAEEAEVERFYEDLQDLLELKPKRDVLFSFAFRFSTFHSFSTFHTVHGVLKARILKWFAIAFSSDFQIIQQINYTPT